MKKIIVLFFLFFSFLYSVEDIIREKAIEIVKQPKYIGEILKDTPPEYHKKLFKFIVDFSLSKLEPITENENKSNSFHTAMLALYSVQAAYYEGVPKIIIPAMTKLFYCGYNKKYLEESLGFSWLIPDNKEHSLIYEKNGNGKPFFKWMHDEIKKEFESDYSKYCSSKEEQVFLKKITEYIKHGEKNKEYSNCSRFNSKYIFDGKACMYGKYYGLECEDYDNNGLKYYDHFKCMEEK